MANYVVTGIAYLHTLGITSNINNTGSRRIYISYCGSPRIIVRLVMDFSLGIRLISRRMSNLCNKCVFWAFFLHFFCSASQWSTYLYKNTTSYNLEHENNSLNFLLFPSPDFSCLFRAKRRFFTSSFAFLTLVRLCFEYYSALWHPRGDSSSLPTRLTKAF